MSIAEIGNECKQSIARAGEWNDVPLCFLESDGAGWDFLDRSGLRILAVIIFTKQQFQKHGIECRSSELDPCCLESDRNDVTDCVTTVSAKCTDVLTGCKAS